MVVVVAAMEVHNFLRRNGELDEAFRRAEEVDDDDVEIDLPDTDDEAAAEEDAVSDDNVTWHQLRDYIAQNRSLSSATSWVVVRIMEPVMNKNYSNSPRVL